MSNDTAKILGGLWVFFADGFITGVTGAAGLSYYTQEPIDLRALTVLGVAGGLTSVGRFLQMLKKRFSFEDQTTTTTAAGDVIVQKTTVEGPKADPPKLPVVVAIAVLAAALSACPKPGRPPQPPGPTPPPASGTFDELLLSRNGRAFTDTMGKPVAVQGEASCCFSEDPEKDPGWALASRAFIERTAQHGGNLIHVRLGPYRVQPDWGPEQVSAGSPYLEVGGKADLSQWDPTFWSYIEDKLKYAGSLGVRFEVDLADGWGLKWQKWRPDAFPQGHPWVASSNLQGQDWMGPAGTRAIVPGDVWFAWIEKIVQVTGRYGNVLYQVGNENGQIPGHVAEWETSSCNAVHAAEQKFGYRRHLCGSNVPEKVANRAEIDFLTVHNERPLDQLQCGDLTRPCRNNEYNPNPPYTGEQMFQLFCAAKGNGTYWDFWRHGMSLAQAQVGWDLIKAGCAGAGPVGCMNIPNEDAVQVLPKPPLNETWADALNAAMVRLHPECHVGGDCPVGVDLQGWLQQIAAEVRKGDATHPKLCAGIQTDGHGPVDEVAIGTEDLVQGHHAYACPRTCPASVPGEQLDTCRPGCTGGKARWAPGSYNESDTWRRPGVGAMATRAAAAPPRAPDWKNRTDKVQDRGRRPAQP